MRISKITRRGLIGIAGATAVLMVTACAGGTTAADGEGGGEAEDGPITLELGMWGDSNRADLYQSAADLYQEKHPNVTIDIQYADLPAYLERLATSAAAKDLPDVMFMRDSALSRYATGGALLDLNEYIGDTVNVDNLGESAVSAGELEDGVYALPTHYVGQALIYNTRIFEEEGLDIADIETWDDLADVATQLSDPDNGFWGVNDGSLEVSQRPFEAFVRQKGQEVFTEDGGIGFDEDVAIEWYEYWKDLRDAGAIPPADVVTEANSAGLTNTVLATNKAAIGVQSTNHLTQLQALTQEPLALGTLPVTDDSTDDWWFFPPILISAAANTAHPETAADFIDFILNDVDAGLITGVNQGAPSSSEVRDALTPALDEQQAAFVEQISREQQEPSRPFPVRPEGSEQLATILLRAGEEIAYGRQSVEEAVATLMDDANRALPGK